MAQQGVTIKPGHNVWVLARTDRDAPSPEQARESAAGFLDYYLGDGGVITPFESPLGPDDVSRYYIGAARPIEFRASLQRPAIAGGNRQVYTDQPGVFAIRATQPWYIVAEFDWRGPETTVDWPHQAKAHSNVPLPDSDRVKLDWLLLESRHQSPQAKWPDSSVSSDYGTAAGDVVKKVTNAGANILLAVGGVLLLALMVQGGRR